MLTSLSNRNPTPSDILAEGKKVVTRRDEWASTRIKEDERLYELYGNPLEKEFPSKFVAIGPDGQTILGDDDAKVLEEAIEKFGGGNFAFTRIGDRTLGRWLDLQT